LWGKSCPLPETVREPEVPSQSGDDEFVVVKRDLPHSMQLALNREVIKPHDGHIRWDLIPAVCGLSPRIL
jgi:hypothetical protein